MKKLFAFLLTGVMVLGSSVVGFAAENKATVMSEACTTVLENLDEDMHGGLYYEGDVLHIKPMEEASVQAVVMSAEQKTRSFGSDIVVDDAAKYSYSELLTAKEAVFDKADELEIYGAGISSKNNSIRIVAEEWTDEKKEAVYEAAGIENVLFELKEDLSFMNPPVNRVMEDNSALNVPVNEASEDNGLRATTPLPAGSEIFRYNSNGSRYLLTLGASVTLNGDEGFLTAGHDVYEGDKIYSYQSYKILGTVVKQKNSGSVDFAFIKRASDSPEYLTRQVKLLNGGIGTISSSRYPTVEGAVVIIGSQSGGTPSTIKDVSFSMPIPGANEDLILFKEYTHCEGGDSGAPILHNLGGGKYAILGIWKGYVDKNSDELPLGIKFNNIRDNYGVQIY